MATRGAAFAHPSPTDKGSTTRFQLCQPGVCCWEPSSGGFGEERAFNEGFASSGFFLCFGEHSAQLCTLSLCLPFLCKVPLFKQARDICPHPAVSSPLTRVPCISLCCCHPGQHGGKGDTGPSGLPPTFTPFRHFFPPLSVCTAALRAQHRGRNPPLPHSRAVHARPGGTQGPPHCSGCCQGDPGATSVTWVLPV